ADEAAGAAEDASGGTAAAEPRLVVVPSGIEGVLAWEVRISTGSADTGQELYFIDAATGDVVAVRPAVVAMGRSAGSPAAPGTARAQVSGEAVQVSGAGPGGQTLTGTALRTEDGDIALVDTSTPIYDPATGQGAVLVHDAEGIPEDDPEGLPGPLVTAEDAEVDDVDAMAALAYTRAVLDYYHEAHGRNSWDGRGGSFIASVRYGTPDGCNAMFNGAQMLYWPPCVLNDEVLLSTNVDIDTVGHEITHGVNQESSGLIYVGQSGALDESFADYWGNVIGNRFKGIDGGELFEDGCPGENDFCFVTPEGRLTAFRYMLNGATMSDYVAAVNPPALLTAMGIDQDHGGVHINSAIWNNAMWTARARLAQIDGVSGNDSLLAQALDRAVYAGYTRGLTATSGFLDARRAIEQAAVEIGADPTVLRVFREVMDQNAVCEGCVAAPGTPGAVVTTQVAPEIVPVVDGEQVAWLSVRTAFGSAGVPMRGDSSGSATALPATQDVASVAFAGEAVVATGESQEVVRFPPGAGAPEVLASDIGCGIVGVAGTGQGAAWIDCERDLVAHVDAAGQVTTTAIPDLDGLISSFGGGGGRVVLGTDTGAVVAWTVGGQTEVVARVTEPVVWVDAFGDTIAVNSLDLEDPRAHATVTLLDAGGSQTVLSRSASPLGLSISDRYVVWAEYGPALPGAINQRHQIADTDLRVYSRATGRTYVALAKPGQQAFPDVSGNRLVWQDASAAGDDVMTGTLPEGL
ncbi:MAG: M4 family metallopeptidase, partial [Actinomycetota bacterium]|nr:M4 family metallopeptidase [Actinomycetota bacterium]